MKNEIKNFTQPRIDRVVAALVEPDWTRKEAYADFLAQIYYYVAHTTRILAAAGSRFPLDRQDLHQRCMSHAAEEKSHELLSYADLKTLGYRPEDFTELPATKCLYRSAYYLIERVSPMSLVGYAYFLEWLAVAGGSRLLEIVEPLYGKNAVKHLHVHAKEDPHHIVVVEEMLERLPAADRACIEESIATAATEFERMIREVHARAAIGMAEGQRHGLKPARKSA